MSCYPQDCDSYVCCTHLYTWVERVNEEQHFLSRKQKFTSLLNGNIPNRCLGDTIGSFAFFVISQSFLLLGVTLDSSGMLRLALLLAGVTQSPLKTNGSKGIVHLFFIAVLLM